MDRQLVVKEEILIEAPASKVWEVLVAPKYIRQWDDLPADFGDYYLELGRVIEWTGYSRLTVAVHKPQEELYLSLYSFKWEQPASAYDIGYRYRLQEAENGTRLSLEIGDFGMLPEGGDYCNSSLEFAKTALDKIKSLAENRL